MPYIEVTFLVCIGITAVSIVATLVSATRMLGKLKRGDPGEFERLGSPHIVMNNTPRTNLRIFSFLKDREYEALGDQTIVKAASTTRKMYVTTFCLFALSLALLIVVWAST